MSCEHDWNTTSALRLVIEAPDEIENMLASVIPMAPRKLPVDYCRACGLVRLKPDDLVQLRKAEEKT